jgi:peroxiredoxin
MRRLTVLIASLALGLPVLADDSLERQFVVVEEPRAPVTKLAFDLRVKLDAPEGATVTLERRSNRGRVQESAPLRRLADGRWGADGLSTGAFRGNGLLVIRCEGQPETIAPFVLTDRTGWAESVILAPGSEHPTLELRDVKGEPLKLPATRDTPTLVFFYGSAMTCDCELAFLRAVRRRWPVVQIVGVGSVAKDGVEAWQRHLAERKADWANVADTEGKIAEAWSIRRHVVGNEAREVVMFLVQGGKVLGGDCMDRTTLLEPDGAPRRYLTVDAIMKELEPGPRHLR